MFDEINNFELTRLKITVINILRFLNTRYKKQKLLLNRINEGLDNKITSADLSRYLSGQALPAGERLISLTNLFINPGFKEIEFINILQTHSKSLTVGEKTLMDFSYLLSDTRALSTLSDLCKLRELITLDQRSFSLMNENISKIITIEVDGIPFAKSIAQSLGNSVDMTYIRKTPTFDVISESEWGKFIAEPQGGRLQLFYLPRKFVKKGERVLIVDDVVSSGSSIRGMNRLISELGGIVIGALVLYSHNRYLEIDNIPIISLFHQ